MAKFGISCDGSTGSRVIGSNSPTYSIVQKKSDLNGIILYEQKTSLLVDAIYVKTKHYLLKMVQDH